MSAGDPDSDGCAARVSTIERTQTLQTAPHAIQYTTHATRARVRGRPPPAQTSGIASPGQVAKSTKQQHSQTLSPSSVARSQKEQTPT